MKLSEVLPISKAFWFSTLSFFLFIAGMTTVFMLALSAPTKWDHAVALRICRDGTVILRRIDGSIWARRSAVIAYRVEDEARICN